MSMFMAQWQARDVNLANSTSPILRLPNEILAEIAAACQKSDRPYRTPSELTLSQVCQRFRRVLTGTSTLWTRIALNFFRQGSVKLSQLYFERSAACKIEVGLRAFGDRLEEQSLDLLIPHIKRLSQLSIDFNTHQALDRVLAPFAYVAAPCLEHVTFEHISEPHPYRLPANLFPLESNRMSSLAMYDCSLSAPLPRWMNTLTRLELRENSCIVNNESDIFRDITTHLPSLTHLYVQMDESQYVHGRSGIVSKCLTYFHLQFNNGEADTIVDALTFLETPALTHLFIHDIHGDQISVLFNSIADAQSTQMLFPAVTSLSFICVDDGCPEEPSWYSTIPSPPLRAFPALSSLTLVEGCYTARILSETLGSNSSPWPLLDTVTLRPIETAEDAVYSVLQDVVQWKRSRQEAVPKFRLCPNLFYREYWAANGVEVELLKNDELFDGPSW